MTPRERDRAAAVNGGAPQRTRPRVLSHAERTRLLAWLLYEDDNERARQAYDDEQDVQTQ